MLFCVVWKTWNEIVAPLWSATVQYRGAETACADRETRYYRTDICQRNRSTTQYHPSARQDMLLCFPLILEHTRMWNRMKIKWIFRNYHFTKAHKTENVQLRSYWAQIASHVCVCVSLITYIYSAAFRFRTCCLKQQNPSKVNLSKANFLYSTVVTCSRARQQMQSKDNVLTCLAEPPTRHKHMQNCYVCNFTVLHRHQVTVCWLFSSSHLISQ